VAWTAGVAALLVLLGSFVLGFGVQGALAEQAAAQERARTAVSAVVEQDVPVIPEAGSKALAPVRWTGPDGVERTGTAAVVAPQAAGDRVRVWVGADHRPVAAPLTGFEVGVVAGTAAATVFVVGELLVLFLGRLAFAGVARVRAAEWEREWEDVEPRWTKG
jgi:hypothetical protein